MKIIFNQKMMKMKGMNHICNWLTASYGFVFSFSTLSMLKSNIHILITLS